MSRRLPEICGIYLITVRRPYRLPLYYVGQSIQCRRRRTYHFKALKARRHDNVKLQNAYNKYGKDSFIFEVLEKCSHEEIDQAEQWWLDEIHGYARTLNIAKDSTSPNRGRKFSEETRRKVSEAGRGRVKTTDERAAISARMRGVALPEETKRKIAETKAARAHLYTKRIGRLHHAAKPVEGVSLLTGEVVRFDSARLAKTAGFDQGGVSKVCRGELNHYKGFVWRYIAPGERPAETDEEKPA